MKMNWDGSRHRNRKWKEHVHPSTVNSLRVWRLQMCSDKQWKKNPTYREKEGVPGSRCCKGRGVFWTLYLAAPCVIVSLFCASGIMTAIASSRIQTVIVQSPGKMTRSTLGSASRYLAAAMAFLKCCSIRRCNVFSPRLHRKQSKGDGTPPSAEWRDARMSLGGKKEKKKKNTTKGTQ